MNPNLFIDGVILKDAATFLFNTYSAFKEAGFTESQAFTLTRDTICAVLSNSGGVKHEK